MQNSRSKNTFSEKKVFSILREMSPLYLRSNKCTMAMSLDVWIFEVNVVGYVMLFGVDGSLFSITHHWQKYATSPEMPVLSKIATSC